MAEVHAAQTDGADLERGYLSGFHGINLIPLWGDAVMTALITCAQRARVKTPENSTQLGLLTRMVPHDTFQAASI
jgi:hypothetical protein